jgi:hypothetical protein
MALQSLGITLEPDDLRVLGTAFDEAWADLAPDFAQMEDRSVAGARMKLARIMLELTNLRQLSGEELKRTAVRIFREEPKSAVA